LTLIYVVVVGNRVGEKLLYYITPGL